MDADLKRRWVEALRSGDYTQGRNLLCANGKHCCLGVLADLINPDKWDDARSPGVRKWTDEYEFAGISAIDPKYVDGSSNRFQLIKMNDVEHIDFNGIAEWIEENIDGT